MYKGLKSIHMILKGNTQQVYIAWVVKVTVRIEHGVWNFKAYDLSAFKETWNFVKFKTGNFYLVAGYR